MLENGLELEENGQKSGRDFEIPQKMVIFRKSAPARQSAAALYAK